MTLSLRHVAAGLQWGRERVYDATVCIVSGWADETRYKHVEKNTRCETVRRSAKTNIKSQIDLDISC